MKVKVSVVASKDVGLFCTVIHNEPVYIYYILQCVHLQQFSLWQKTATRLKSDLDRDQGNTHFILDSLVALYLLPKNHFS